MKGDKMITAVIIPCYNEELTIRKVIEDYRKVLPDAEIYVIDNNSVDRTAAIAEECGVFLMKESKQGKGCAVRKAFEEIDADTYVLVDGDDTYPPDESIIEMIRLSQKGGYDLVIGDRLESYYFKENKSILHSAGNVIVPFLFRLLYHCNIRDIMSGSRVMSRSYVKSFPANSDGFVIETEMMIYALKHNCKMTSVPIKYRDRPEGSYSKISSLKDGSSIIKEIFISKFK